MDYKSILGFVSALFAFIQYTPYIADVLRHKTKPHAFSWFVWGVPCGIVFAAQLVKGAGAGSWATAATTIFCTAIFVLSLFYGEKNITRLDKISLALALVALGWWAATKDPLGSVILVTVADVLGFLPTFRKSIAKPYEETISVYIIGAFKWLLALPALDVLNVTTYFYPVGMVLANFFISLILWHLRVRVKKKAKSVA